MTTMCSLVTPPPKMSPVGPVAAAAPSRGAAVYISAAAQTLCQTTSSLQGADGTIHPNIIRRAKYCNARACARPKDRSGQAPKGGGRLTLTY